MSNEFSLSAEVRSDEFQGKGASRRLRRLADRVPAIVYGGEKEPQAITLEHRKIIKALENEAFYSHILDLDIAGDTQKVVVKAIQRHPYKPKVTHLDFLRVSAKQKITMQVPLHFIGEDVCVGVKTGGGVISHAMNDVEISCLPQDLPEFIEVDLSNVELNQIVHLKDLKLPKGVELTALTHGTESDLPVASVHTPKKVVEEEPTVADDADAEGDDKKSESGDNGES